MPVTGRVSGLHRCICSGLMRNSHTYGRGALINALTRQTPTWRPRLLIFVCFIPHRQSSRKDLLRLDMQRDGSGFSKAEDAGSSSLLMGRRVPVLLPFEQRCTPEEQTDALSVAANEAAQVRGWFPMYLMFLLFPMFHVFSQQAPCSACGCLCWGRRLMSCPEDRGVVQIVAAMRTWHLQEVPLPTDDGGSLPSLVVTGLAPVMIPRQCSLQQYELHLED